MKEITTKEIQAVSLEILNDVHEFCVDHHIHYTLQGGRLLGAACRRHVCSGFNSLCAQSPTA